MPNTRCPLHPAPPDGSRNYETITGGTCPGCGSTAGLDLDTDLHVLTCSACFGCYRIDADARTARRIAIADLIGPAGDTAMAPMHKG